MGTEFPAGEATVGIREHALAGRERLREQDKRLGRQNVAPKVEDAIRSHLRAGNGILKVPQIVSVPTTIKAICLDVSQHSRRRKRHRGYLGLQAVIVRDGLLKPAMIWRNVR